MPDITKIDTDTLKARADALRQQSRALTPRDQLLGHTLEELETNLEELRVSEEELRVQNEALQEMSDALDLQAQRYRDLFEQVPEAFLVTDADGVIQEANPAAETLLNMGARSLVGRSLEKFVAPAERTRFCNKILPMALEATRSEWFLNLQMRGENLSVALTVMASRNAAGHVGALRWLLRNAAALGPLDEEHYRAAMQELTDYAVLLMSDEGRILFWNTGAELVFGYAPEEIVGRDAAVLYTPEDLAQDAETQERDAARTAGRAEDERWHLRKDGSRFWGSGILTRLSGGSPARFAKVVRDMTSRKQAEERSEAELARQRRIAHTLQNALLPDFSEDAFPGFAVAAFYEPAWEEARVGGDFYDIIPLHDHRIAFVVGDVAGKGLDAAARTGEIKASLRAFLREDPDPATALARLNMLVCDSELLDGIEEHLLVVAAVIVVDSRMGNAQCASAGLEPPLIARASGEIESLPMRGLTLGVQRGIAYEAHARHLDVHDLLVLATDGLTEARRDRAFLGHDGLSAIVRQALPCSSPREVGTRILEEVRRFTSGSPNQSALQDDACLLLACRLSAPQTVLMPKEYPK